MYDGGEDLADAVEGDHAFGEAGSAGVPEAGDGDAFADGGGDCCDDAPASVHAEGAAFAGGVGGEGDGGGSVDPSAPGEHTGFVPFGQ